MTTHGDDSSELLDFLLEQAKEISNLEMDMAKNQPEGLIVIGGKAFPNYAPMTKFTTQAPEGQDQEAVPAPELDMSAFEVIEVRDFEDKRMAGRGRLDTENQKLYAYMHVHYASFELNYEALGNEIQADPNRTMFMLKNIGYVEEDFKLLPVCKFYAPAKGQNSSELPDWWVFDRPMVTPSCTSPARGYSRKAPGLCSAQAPYFNSCDAFQKLEACIVAEVVGQDGEVLAQITKQYIPARQPIWTVSGVDDKSYDTLEALQGGIEEVFGADVKLVSVATETNGEVSYFKKVLSNA